MFCDLLLSVWSAIQHSRKNTISWGKILHANIYWNLLLMDILGPPWGPLRGLLVASWGPLGALLEPLGTSSGPQEGPKSSQEGPKSSQELPRGPLRAPKRAPRAPQEAPRGLKSAPRGASGRPRGSPKPPKDVQMVIKSTKIHCHSAWHVKHNRTYKKLMIALYF